MIGHLLYFHCARYVRVRSFALSQRKRNTDRLWIRHKENYANVKFLHGALSVRNTGALSAQAVARLGLRAHPVDAVHNAGVLPPASRGQLLHVVAARAGLPQTRDERAAHGGSVARQVRHPQLVRLLSNKTPVSDTDHDLNKDSRLFPL